MVAPVEEKVQRHGAGETEVSDEVAGGLPGLAWAQHGNVRALFDLLVSHGRISVIETLVDTRVIRELKIQPL